MMILNRYKNFYFLTEGISNYGGAQLLVLRRANYLQNLGYCVKVIVHRHRGDFLLKDKFENIPILFLPDLEFPFSVVNCKRKEELSKIIELFLGNTSNCILETHSLQTAVWGEYFASILNIKHIVYLLNEARVDKYRYYPGVDFFKYKYKKGELYGTSNLSLSVIFNNCFDESNIYENYINVSFDPDELTLKSIPPIQYISYNNSVTISTLARLEKRYIEPMIRSVIKYANENPEQHINLIIAGGTIFTELYEELKAKFLPPELNLPNLHIIFTGYIVQLGLDFFQKTDIFIGMGTAAINAISQGCATLNIDPRTSKTSGIFGVDTDNFAYPNENNVYEIEDKISSLLNNRLELIEAKQKGKDLFNQQYTVKASFDKLEILLLKSQNAIDYYFFKPALMNRCFDYILLKIRMVKYNLKFK